MNREIQRIPKIEGFKETELGVLYREPGIITKIPSYTQSLIDSKADEEIVLPRDGSREMLGDLTLAGAPSQDLHAATKKYVDDAVGGGGHTHTLDAGATDVTAIAAEVNLLDLSGLSVGQVLRATGAASATWGSIQTGDLPAGIDAANIADGSVSDAEYQYLNGVTSAIQTQLNAKAADSIVLKKDGTIALTADWDIGDGRKIIADEIRARDTAGLKLYNDGEVGILVDDNGNVLLPGSGYLNFNTTGGAGGHGFRSDAGIMQYKDLGGAWTAIPGGDASTLKIKIVTDYGATGDGVTDDSDDIITAIAACSAGDTLYFPIGKYFISKELTVANNLNILGAGPATQIYQSADHNIFNFTGTGYFRIANMRLGSEATTAGKCMIRAVANASHSLIRNIIMKGGHFGIGLYGTLNVLVEHCSNTTEFWHSVSATNVAWIYGERYGSRSINGVRLSHNLFQAQGACGIYLTDDHNEGSVDIDSGLCEYMTTGIYVNGFYDGLHIDGVHCEGNPVELVSCQHVLINNLFCNGLILTSCHQTKIMNSYLWGGVTISPTCEGIKVDGCNITSDTDINGRMVDVTNISDTRDISVRQRGKFLTDKSYRNLCDGLMEEWVVGVPLGFSGYPSSAALVEETTTLRFGTRSCKVIVPAGQTKAKLRFYLDPSIWKIGEDFIGGSVTVKCWVWKPASGGYSPNIMITYTSPSEASAIPTPFSVDAEIWTAISQTFKVSTSYTNGYLEIGTNSASPGEYIFVAGVQIVDGEVAAAPYYDDSRGLLGNFRVGGNSLRGGQVTTMTGHATFSYGDGELHIIDPGGAPRNFNPSGNFPKRAEIWVINTADNAETITFDSTGIAQAIAQNERGFFVYSGSAWIKVYVGS